jgi:biopolymer transport protein TolR
MAMMAGTRGLNAQMNVTPLVDVLLVLLIIFMIAPRNDPHGLETQLPQDSLKEQPTKPPDTAIVLQVLRGSGNESLLRINREDVAWPDLAARLRGIYKLRASKIMFIHGDQDVEFGQIARAIDAAREADRGIAIGLLNKEIATN